MSREKELFFEDIYVIFDFFKLCKILFNKLLNKDILN